MKSPLDVAVEKIAQAVAKDFKMQLAVLAGCELMHAWDGTTETYKLYTKNKIKVASVGADEYLLTEQMEDGRLREVKFKVEHKI